MRVTVVTTLFNYANFVAKAVKSFLSQDMTDSEMVIVNDGSTDHPEKILKPMLSDRVRVVVLPKNHGYSYAKNVGIRESRSEILVMLDADDYLLPGSLSLRYEAIQKGFDFVHGPALDFVDGKLSPSKLWKQYLEKPSYKRVHAQGVMLRKQIHREIGLYDESLRCKSDREMWARIFNHGYRIGTVDQPVVVYRMHPNQMHRSKEKAAINDRLQAEVLEKISRRAIDLSDVEMLS